MLLLHLASLLTLAIALQRSLLHTLAHLVAAPQRDRSRIISAKVTVYDSPKFTMCACAQVSGIRRIKRRHCQESNQRLSQKHVPTPQSGRLLKEGEENERRSKRVSQTMIGNTDGEMHIPALLSQLVAWYFEHMAMINDLRTWIHQSVEKARRNSKVFEQHLY
jgi:hypothetical protein